MNSPRVSIVIPAYNAVRWLDETVSSVKAQTFTDWEIIIVNDGSTDDTATLIQELAAGDVRIKGVHQSNSGHCAARNTGLAQTSAEVAYVIFLDADDLWETDALEALVSSLDQQPQACGAYGYCRYIDQQGQFCRGDELEVFHRERYRVAENGRLETVPPNEFTTFCVIAVYAPIVTVGSVLLRKKDVLLNGLFDEQLYCFEDWDQWARLTPNSFLVWLDKPVLRYRWHGENMSQDGHRMGLAERAARKKMLRYFPANTPEGRIMRLGAWYHRMINARRYRHSGQKHLMVGRVLPAIKDALRSVKQLSLALRRE